MADRKTCYTCEDCHRCFKHNVCESDKCIGTFEFTCRGQIRKYKIGIEVRQ